MQNKEKIFSRKSAPQRAARMVEAVFRCKWSLTVFQLLDHGVNRPGEMVRSVQGLSKKVLYDCLNRLVEFEILERVSFNESPPRVEYSVTDFGKKFVRILHEIELLQGEFDNSEMDNSEIGASKVDADL